MDIIKEVSNGVIEASISKNSNKINFLKKAIKEEENDNAIWALELMVKNLEVANEKKLPLCDDTGIPHVIIELGKNREISGKLISEINEGIIDGLKRLPGRPMAVKGNDIERLEQSAGLYDEGEMLKPANFIIDTENNQSTYSRIIDDDSLNINIALLGGGPEIRAKTYRIFHKKSHEIILNEIVDWLKNSLKLLGCTPAIPSIGIGRTHTESNILMLKSLIYGNLENQSNIENYINNELNKTDIGPLGLSGKTTVLGSFVNIGPQRASGVRIASVRSNCFVEPRVSTIKIR